MVKQKKINSDQKAQILKKPQLEAQVAQLEEQQKNFNEFAQELEARFEKEKATIAQNHNAEIERLKEEAAQNSTGATEKKVKEALQVACQFLHAAAYQRQRDDVDESEKQAYEAVLFHLYQGNSTAIETITNIVEGKELNITEPSGDEIDFTFAQLKISAMTTLSEDQADAQGSAETEAEAEAEAEAETETTPATEEVTTDPTIANASLTELEDTAAIPTSASEDNSQDDIPPAAPEQVSTTGEAANAVAENAWNPEASTATENTQTSEDWVQVPRDPAETETGALPAPQQSTSNWADEAGAAAEEKGSTPVSENDGFSEVRRDRGGRGRGGRGGRGFDGRGRGRGRGEYRGRGGRGRGAPRGAPQAQAS